MPDWQSILPAEQWEHLRHDLSFHAVIKVARITNTLRFAHQAAFSVEDSDAPAATRQRLSSFLYTVALLYEALRFTETLGKYFCDWSSYRDGFGALHGDKDTTQLRSGILQRARDKAVFHIDNSLPATSLAEFALGAPYVFAASNSDLAIDVHYALADSVFLHFVLDTPSDGDDFKKRFVEAFTGVMALATRFADSADRLISEFLVREGGSMQAE